MVFKIHCQNQLQALRDDYIALQKQVDSQLIRECRPTIHSILAKSDNGLTPIDFDALATSVSLPAEIMDRLKAEPIKIVDVGALELKGQTDSYEALYATCPCDVIGFDPQNSQIIKVNQGNSAKTILPIAVGDGQMTRFYHTEYTGASSTLKPNGVFLKQFNALPNMLAVHHESVIETRRLDDLDETNGCDLLRIDVHGQELSVLKGCRGILEEISVVLTKVQFAPVYEDQPFFADVDTFLRDQGFFLQNLINPGFVSFRAGLFDDLKSRLMWMDTVYVKEPSVMEKLSPKRILKAAVITHVLLKNPGLTASILEVFDRKTGSRLLEGYQTLLHILRDLTEKETNP